MICGVTYNVFNGEEHLLHSLRSIRPSVDYINLVVQFVSNNGNLASNALLDCLNDVSNEKLVDFIYLYNPNFNISCVENEVIKRNIGLTSLKKAGVTHFMTMDCDEYYPQHEFENAKEIIIVEKLQTTAVKTYLHIKRPVYRSEFPDTTCCAFLTKIHNKSKIVLNETFPALVDPTRGLHGDTPHFKLFCESIVSMRHMNLVRYDLENKLKNSSNAHMTEFMGNVSKVAYSD